MGRKKHEGWNKKARFWAWYSSLAIGKGKHAGWKKSTEDMTGIALYCPPVRILIGFFSPFFPHFCQGSIFEWREEKEKERERGREISFRMGRDMSEEERDIMVVINCFMAGNFLKLFSRLCFFHPIFLREGKTWKKRENERDNKWVIFLCHEDV